MTKRKITFSDEPHALSLRDCVRAYGKYIIPVWIMPVYLVALGFGVSMAQPKAPALIILVAGAPVFLISFVWSLIPCLTGKISPGKHSFLVMFVPFLIFGGIACILVTIMLIGQLVIGN